MNLKELCKIIKKGDTVYKIEDTYITIWIYLGPHPTYGKYYQGFGYKGNASKAEFISIERIIASEDWQISYEDAKEEMWRQLIKKVNSINQIYFNGKKSIP